MFDKILEILSQFWENLVPCVIVNQYERGILLRFGMFRKEVSGGLVWKIPFIDEVIRQTFVTTTIRLNPQSLITKDKKNIVVRAIIKYEIDDMKIFLLDVTDANDALCDVTQSIIRQAFRDNDFAECLTGDLDSSITTKAKTEAKKWGIKIHKVTLVDIGEIRSYRIINDNTILNN